MAGLALVWLPLDGKTAICHPSHQELIVKNASAVCEQAVQRKKQFKEIGISLETKVWKQFYCHLERQTLEVAEVVARSSYAVEPKELFDPLDYLEANPCYFFCFSF